MKLFFCENHQTKLRLPFTEWKKLKDTLERTYFMAAAVGGPKGGSCTDPQGNRQHDHAWSLPQRMVCKAAYPHAL